MSLGLTTEELRKFFKDEYGAILERRRADLNKYELDLIAHGMPVIDAKKEALYQIRQESIIQALLLTIQANNSRIEYQLKI